MRSPRSLRERGDAAREVVEPVRDLARARCPRSRGDPSCRLGERDLEAEVGLDELRDLPQRVAEAGARILGAVGRRVAAPGSRPSAS